MSLTMADGPLSSRPPERNFRFDGPREHMMLGHFPRRVRAILGGVTVLDSERARLLHRTGRLPQLYVPAADVRVDLIQRGGPDDEDPVAGERVCWTMSAGGRDAPGAVWEHRGLPDEAGWLQGLLGVEFRAMDAWLDEDEEVVGHLRDPYHRIDARQSRRMAEATIDGSLVARSDRPMVLSETGLPNHIYFPAEDVDLDLIRPSDTETVCPYKGEALWWARRADGADGRDVGWSYPEPLEDAIKVAGHLSFSGEGVTVTHDGMEV